MSTILYYFFLPFVYFLSIQPMWFLYRVSDVLFLITYYLIGYRKKVVRANLRNSFPEKTEQELRIIERKFYSHLCDLLVEMLKMITISKRTIRRRVKMHHTQTLYQFLDKGRSVILVLGHYANWEWCIPIFGWESPYPLHVIYHPLTSVKSDQLIYKARKRAGAILTPMKETIRTMVQNRETVWATALVADQTPPKSGAFWTTFLNQPTPIFTGTEKLAQKLNQPVIYVDMNKRKRGYYDIYFEVLSETPNSTQPGEITLLHTKFLEEKIKKQPEHWLWSHRRWKHTPPPDFQA